VTGVAAPGRRRRGDAGGFTLIEVLVALAVLAAVLSSAFGVFSTGLRGLSRSDERLTLALFAESLLTRSGLDLARGADAEASGSTADGLSWRVRRVPFQLPKARSTRRSRRRCRRRPIGRGTRRRRGSAGTAPLPPERKARIGSRRRARRPRGTDTADGRRGGASGFGGRRSSAAEGGDGTAGPARPSLRLSQVQVVVQNARGESFTLTTLHVERGR
jgi:prepilin-type N-terminal cleavage/methylation domain-containing protein